MNNRRPILSVISRSRWSTGRIVALIAVCAAVILAVDLSLPLGVAGGVPYVVLVLIGMWLPSRRHILYLAGVGTLLTVTGYIFSPTGGVSWVVFTNRGLALFIVWVTALLLLEHKRVEEALRESEQHIRSIVESAQDAIINIDESGTVQTFNRAAERIFGYGADEVIGENVKMLMPEPYHSEHDGYLGRYLETGEAKIIGRGREVLGRRKDGSTVPIGLGVTEMPGEKPRMFVGILRDITQAKQAEEKIRALNTELEQRLVEVTAANEELDAFAYSVSHDLRAPLRSMDGFSQALLEDYSDKLDVQGKDFLQRVRAGSQRLAWLIDDLLKLSRVSRSALNPHQVNLSDLAQTIAAELQETDPERGVTFNIASGVAADGDPRLVRIVLENLLGNAWKFTSKRARAEIRFGSTERDGRLAYYVRDDGVGFDMTYADKLFQPFQRLHSTSDFAGTGIGLATVSRIVSRHGGRVWAESVVDQGTTVYFTL